MWKWMKSDGCILNGTYKEVTGKLFLSPVCQVTLNTVLLYWRDTITNGSLLKKALNWWLAYTLRGWVHAHHDEKADSHGSGVVAESYTSWYTGSRQRWRPSENSCCLSATDTLQQNHTCSNWATSPNPSWNISATWVLSIQFYESFGEMGIRL